MHEGGGAEGVAQHTLLSSVHSSGAFLFEQLGSVWLLLIAVKNFEKHVQRLWWLLECSVDTL
jgi:hypothetical protein